MTIAYGAALGGGPAKFRIVGNPETGSLLIVGETSPSHSLNGFCLVDSANRKLSVNLKVAR